MADKRKLHLDPDYEALPVEHQEKRIKQFEDSVRKQMKDKIVNILKTNIGQEINSKDAEIDALDENLNTVRIILDRLRSCVVTKFYASLGQEQQNEEIVPSLHPTIKKHLDKSIIEGRKCDHGVKPGTSKDTVVNDIINNPGHCFKLSCNSNESTVTNETNNKIPNSSSVSLNENYTTSRLKKKCKIVIGNISKFIPVWQRNESDQSTHKWMVYVRGDKENPDIDGIVKKVRFLLHPSYRPNDIIEISSPPFHLVKRGWGEFPVRVQLHFQDARNKPLDIIHNLKLDKTFTGLQTLGAETVVDLQLFKAENIVNNQISSYHLPPTPSTSTSTLPFTAENSDSCHNSQNNFEAVVKMEIDIDTETNADIRTSTQALEERTIDETNKSADGISNTISSEPIPASNEQSSVTSSNVIDRTNLISNSAPINNLPNNNNVLLKKDTVPNGINTAFVKCTDNDGRVLLVPQSSLVRIKTDKLNAVRTNNNNNLFNNLTNHKSDTSNLSNSKVVVPSYILKVFPNKDNQKQVVLIPMTEKKCNDITKQSMQDKNSVINNMSETECLSPLEEKEDKPKSNLCWEQEIANINFSFDYYKSFVELLRRVSKAFPLVKEGVDRNLYPFCASSLEEYLKWNIGKQRASEWRRAGLIRSAILNLICKNMNTHITSNDVWSRKDIMVWCRKNGFVPMISEKMTLLPEPKWSGVELCSITNSRDLLSVLPEERTHQNSTLSDDEEIDVVVLEKEESSKSKYNQNQQTAFQVPPLSDAALYVKEVASQIGVNIKPVEMELNLCVPVVEEMILASCRELAVNLIGAAVGEGYNRLGGKLCPEEITVSDIYSAIKNNSQFNFLSNSHLGKPKESDSET